MTRDEARAIALEELNKVLASNCTPPQRMLPVLLVGSPGTIAERLTAAAMAAHLWARIEWPVITGGPLVEALEEAGLLQPTEVELNAARWIGAAKSVLARVKVEGLGRPEDGETISELLAHPWPKPGPDWDEEIDA